MARQRHLDNAPITEALIDLRVQPRDGLEVNVLAELPEPIKTAYPKTDERKIFEGQIKVRGGESQFESRPSAIYGYFFHSAEGTQVVQFRPEGFTFSRLRPYTDWDSVRNEARRLWRSYLDVAQPELVTRVAVRYINHMPFPSTMKGFDQYLLAPPQVPESAPQGLSGFLTRVTGRYPDSDITANITQSLEPAEAQKESVVILLDIDVFRAGTDFEPSSDGVWNLLDELREVKNEIFFGSITEPAAELFE